MAAKQLAMTAQIVSTCYILLYFVPISEGEVYKIIFMKWNALGKSFSGVTIIAFSEAIFALCVPHEWSFSDAKLLGRTATRRGRQRQAEGAGAARRHGRQRIANRAISAKSHRGLPIPHFHVSAPLIENGWRKFPKFDSIRKLLLLKRGIGLCSHMKNSHMCSDTEKILTRLSGNRLNLSQLCGYISSLNRYVSLD